MNWNYRLIHMDVSYPDSPWYEIHEVYYDDKGKITYWTENPVTMGHDNKKNVLDSLLVMALHINGSDTLKESKMPGVKPGVEGR